MILTMRNIIFKTTFSLIVKGSSERKIKNTFYEKCSSLILKKNSISVFLSNLKYDEPTLKVN